MSVTQNLEAQNALAENIQANSRSVDQRMFGILTVLAVIWGFLCILNFMLTEIITIDSLMQAYSIDQLKYLQDTPGWVSVAKAMTGIGWLCGAVFLHWRKKSAYHWFSVALVGTLMMMLDSVLRDGYYVLGRMESGVNLGMVIVSILLFWASYAAFYEGQLDD